MKNIIISMLIIMNAAFVYAQSEVDVDALVKKGFSQLSNKAQHQQALEDFERVIECSPAYVDAYIGKAIILKRQGKWWEAKEALLEGSERIEGDQKSGRYIAETAWWEGFYDLARSLDQEYSPDSERKLMGFTDEVILNYGYDWIQKRDDWWELNFTYHHRIRPDHSVLLYYSDFRRAQDNDFLIGLGYIFKWNYMTTLGTDIYFSDTSGFAAEQKYRPRIYFRLPYNFALGIGGNFDKFTDDWAKVSHTEVTKYVNEFYGKYTILAGEDNFDQTVTTHIGELGFEKEDKYTIRMGYAIGNESIERIDRVIDSSVDIDSYFINGKYYVALDWGLNLSLTREYRNDDFFRTTGSIGLFYRF